MMYKHIEANAELAADLLRHMADNEIDSDYFAVVTDSPNCGMEIQSEHKVTDTALMVAGVIDKLLAKLEAAEQALIKPLPIGELIHRLEGQTYRKWYDDDELDKMRVRAEAAEARLLVPVKLPDDGLEDCINMWPDNWRNDFDTGYNFGLWRCEQNIKAAGFTVEGE